MADAVKKFHLWIPLLLLAINIFLAYFMVDELMDASPPNHGNLSFLTPVFGLVSLIYMGRFTFEGRFTYFIWVLQALNWFFIIFPFAVVLYLAMFFIV